MDRWGITVSREQSSRGAHHFQQELQQHEEEGERRRLARALAMGEQRKRITPTTAAQRGSNAAPRRVRSEAPTRATQTQAHMDQTLGRPRASQRVATSAVVGFSGNPALPARTPRAQAETTPQRPTAPPTQRRRPATLDVYDQNDHFKLRMGNGNQRPKPRPTTVRGDGNAFLHMQTKIAGLRALCDEVKDSTDKEEEDSILDIFGKQGATKQPLRGVGTVDLLAQHYPQSSSLRPSQQPLLRHLDGDLHSNRKIMIPLGPTGYWSSNSGEYTRKTHRELFNDSLINIYAGLRDSYLSGEV